MSNPTIIISCPYCHSRQSVPIPVAEGADPWPCEQCGRTIELPRRNLCVPAEKPENQEKRKDGK